ncbi:MAG: phosphatidylserine/phosphatidylglycerophosphate/cardiolipin synthase family protein [Oligoflexia bacterium]|nr:phosphatidylserine/phosphatidylglycerophosphate/cardiolipin synthase family protein [Oligoflexia bacterium]
MVKPLNKRPLRFLVASFLLWTIPVLAEGPAAAPPCPSGFALLQHLASSGELGTALRLSRILKKNPGLKARVSALFAGYQSGGTLFLREPEAQKTVLELGVVLQDSGELPGLLKTAAGLARKAGKLPAEVPPEKVDEMVVQLAGAIDAELSARGLTQAGKGAHYEDWVALSHRLNRDVDKVMAPFKGKRDLFDDPEFLKAYERETGATFTSGNTVKLLADAPAALARRLELIRGAKSEINFMTWAFYDDEGGRLIGRELIAKAKQGVKVRVIVDGQIAMKGDHSAILKEMAENGVEVVRWRSTDPLRRYDGQHRKVMIVDGIESITGGRNPGDPYFHTGPADAPKWTDSEIHIRGSASADSNRLFAEIWNDQVRARAPATDGKRLLDGFEVHEIAESAPVPGPAAKGGARISVVNHVPGRDENIQRATLLAIEAARDSIDIANAYFILDPALYRALLRAKARGVKVRVFTNSAESIDEPAISIPILKSVNRLAAKGIEVYLKKGDTLHSKLMVVDGSYAWVGSHNLHPRSFRYEGEIIEPIRDRETAQGLSKIFTQEIGQAARITEPLQLPEGDLADIGQQLMYDQL